MRKKELRNKIVYTIILFVIILSGLFLLNTNYSEAFVDNGLDKRRDIFG